jgi:hypothetical protein
MAITIPTADPRVSGSAFMPQLRLALEEVDALHPMTTLGDVIYGGAAGAPTRLPGNTTTTKKFLAQTGNGTNSAAPTWIALSVGDISGLVSSQWVASGSDIYYNTGKVGPGC